VTDLLRQGSQWLGDMLKEHASSEVTYRRPSPGSGQATELEVNATFGSTEYEVEDDYGLRVGAEVTDFLILGEDLSPTFGEPEAGDQTWPGRDIGDGAIRTGQPCGFTRRKPGANERM